MSEPSSRSLKPAEQVKDEPVTTPVLGLIAMPVEVGGVLSMVTLADVENAVAPLESVTLAVQVIVSEPLIMLGDNCHVVPVFVAPPLDVHV